MSEFATAADEHITNLIEHLSDEAQRFARNGAERQEFVDQIAKLRASQNPTVVQNFYKS